MITAPLERGDIFHRINATGTLKAVTTVQVGSQVTGRIQNLYADFNSNVKKGQILAQIDPANFQAQVIRVEAELETARAGIRNAESNLANRKAERLSARANFEAAQVVVKDAQRILKRTQELFAEKLVSERELEASQAGYEQAAARANQASAQVSQSEMSIRSSEAQLEMARAQLQQARAQLEMAQINLKYTVITSPIDGVVIERNVDLGQTVSASLQAPTLFLIANDLRQMQVVASVDEADIGFLNEDVQVEFTVDAFPGEIFRGRVSEIRLNAVTTQNVVTYNAIIDVFNEFLKLRPGMTANLRMMVAKAEDVIKIPNAALRYRPKEASSEKVQALLRTFREETSSEISIESPALTKPPVRAETSRPAKGGRAERAPVQPDLRFRQDAPASPRSGDWSRRGEGAGVRRPLERGQTKPQADPREHPSTSKVRFPKLPPFRPQARILWISEGKEIRPVPVVTGLTDGSFTAMLRGDLREGQVIVLGETVSAGDENSLRPAVGPTFIPFAGGPRPGGGARRANTTPRR